MNLQVPQDLYNFSPIILYVGAVVVSFLISLYAVRKIIFIARHRKIYDIPDDIRKFHGVKIPSLGGVGIFTGYVIPAAFFMYLEPRGWSYIVASSVILFFTGAYDDLMNMRPSKKLMAQLLASLLTVVFTGVRIKGFGGMMGLSYLPEWGSIVFTTLACTFFINVFNFIDGIDGLACSLAICYLFVLSFLFAIMGSIGIAGIVLCLAGATAGLFYYNAAPARVYMGDTGSMLLGYSIFVFSVLALNRYSEGWELIQWFPTLSGFLVFLLAMLFLPVFDALRVFVVRMSKGRSPLQADRLHLHYYLLDAGFSHTTSDLILIGANVLLMVLGFVLRDALPFIAIVALTLVAGAFTSIIYRLRRERAQAQS